MTKPSGGYNAHFRAALARILDDHHQWTRREFCRRAGVKLQILSMECSGTREVLKAHISKYMVALEQAGDVPNALKLFAAWMRDWLPSELSTEFLTDEPDDGLSHELEQHIRALEKGDSRETQRAVTWLLREARHDSELYAVLMNLTKTAGYPGGQSAARRKHR